MNSLATRGIALMHEARLDFRLESADRVNIQGRSALIYIRNHVPSPSEIATGNALYFLPRISSGLRDLARSNPRLTLCAPAIGEIWHQGTQLQIDVAPKQPKQQRRVNWARFGLLRALAVSAAPKTQVELARMLGITQGAVSQNLNNLRGLVTKDRFGWKARSFEVVAKEFLDNYPGPGGIEQQWFGLGEVIPQGRKVLAAHPHILLSADSAADELAPHRKARTAMFYNTAGLNLEDLGFARAESLDATLIEVVPEDRTIFPLARHMKTNSLVDGLLAVYDLRRSAGTDAQEAASELLIDLEQAWSKDAN